MIKSYISSSARIGGWFFLCLSHGLLYFLRAFGLNGGDVLSGQFAQTKFNSLLHQQLSE